MGEISALAYKSCLESVYTAGPGIPSRRNPPDFDKILARLPKNGDISHDMSEPVKPKSPFWPMVVIILIPVIGFVLNAPDYIPEWQYSVIILTGVFYLGGLFSIFIWSRRKYKLSLQTRKKSAATGRSVLFGLAFVVLYVLTFGFTALFFDLPFWGNVFVKEYCFPDYGKCLYIYDDSFMEPLTSFKAREGKMPWMNYKTRVPLMNPHDLTITQQDSLITVTDGVRIFNYNLVDGSYTQSQ